MLKTSSNQYRALEGINKNLNNAIYLLEFQITDAWACR